MRISYHARSRRGVSYAAMRKEIANSIQIEIDLARTLLDRADNRRFKEEEDKFMLRKDLLGMYILTRKNEDDWTVVTYIDMSDSIRQSLLKNLYGNKEVVVLPLGKSFNNAIHLSDAILKNYTLKEVNKIKEVGIEESLRIKDIDPDAFPCVFQFSIEFEDGNSIFQISKPSPYRISKISMINKRGE